MAKIPKRYPGEPGGSGQCGASYKMKVTATGLLPGTQFGGHYSEVIKPQLFRNSPKVPKFQTLKQFEDTIFGSKKSTQDKLTSAMATLSLQSNNFSEADYKALEWIGIEAQALIDAARAEAAEIDADVAPIMEELNPIRRRIAAQRLVVDALKHIRCLEYWTARIKLVNQAREEYVAPPEGFGFKNKGIDTAEVFPVPGGAPEGHRSPDAAPEGDPGAEPEKKSNIKLYIAAGAAIAAYFLLG